MFQKLIFTGDYQPGPEIHYPGYAGIGNLEVAFADYCPQTYKAYTSVVPLASMDKIAKFYVALSLANNHVYDAGNFEKTLTLLKKRFPDIQFFGLVEKPYAELEGENGKKIAIISCLERCRSRKAAIFPEESVKELIVKLRTRFDHIIVYPHWGKESEYTHYPSPTQIKLAQSWIDVGAIAVIGHHSHVYQGKITYKGCPIYFSLGNFYFPHPENILYQQTNIGMTVGYHDGKWKTFFHQGASGINNMIPERIPTPNDFNKYSQVLEKNWTTFRWARYVGLFFIVKNMNSWKLRFRNHFWATLPRFIIWQILPKTILFRLGGLIPLQIEEEEQ